ncbi:hypothetical protein BJ912DRAFT_1068878 [Pholiota molesta]|nr:hypothetical protein BJ912DRAFT_1068878 [Pholiota molesta]
MRSTPPDAALQRARHPSIARGTCALCWAIAGNRSQYPAAAPSARPAPAPSTAPYPSVPIPPPSTASSALNDITRSPTCDLQPLPPPPTAPANPVAQNPSGVYGWFALRPTPYRAIGKLPGLRRRQWRAPSCGARQRRARARRVAATTAAAMTPRGRRNAVDVDRRDCPAAAPPIHALVMPALMSYPIAYSLCECRGMPEAMNAGAATAMTRRRGEGRRILPPFLSMSSSQHRGFSAAAATFYEARLSMPMTMRANTMTTTTRMRTAATSARTEHERVRERGHMNDGCGEHGHGHERCA